MRILIANDDGIDAPGLALAVEAAGRLSDDVWVVAPAAKRTAAANSLTMASPVTMKRLGPRRFSCSGTPADCIVAAMAWLFRDGGRPDLVISGINDGRNVAEDLAYSGTLGVAREATFWGLPAIALSRVKKPNLRPGDVDWLAGLLRTLWDRRAEWVAEAHWLSVNLPTDLPAAFAQPSIGRDKIARTAEVVGESGDTVELVFPRGRAHASTPGDENSRIDAGMATINRLSWVGGSALDATLVERLPGL